ncbi:MAG: hypothetical protein Q9226_005695, partial [Calogaya cf. arnoldii]
MAYSTAGEQYHKVNKPLSSRTKFGLIMTGIALFYAWISLLEVELAIFLGHNTNDLSPFILHAWKALACTVPLTILLSFGDYDILTKYISRFSYRSMVAAGIYTAITYVVYLVCMVMAPQAMLPVFRVLGIVVPPALVFGNADCRRWLHMKWVWAKGGGEGSRRAALDDDDFD